MATAPTTAVPATTTLNAGLTTDIGAVANLATEVVKATEQLQTQANTPAMVSAKEGEDQTKVDAVIDTAIATDDQKTIQALAGQE